MKEYPFRALVYRSSDNPLTGQARYRVMKVYDNMYDSSVLVHAKYSFQDAISLRRYISIPVSFRPRTGTFINPKKAIFGKRES